MSMITGPTTTGESILRIQPISPENPISTSSTAPAITAPAMYRIMVAPSAPSAALAPMIPKNAVMKENDTPWIIGSREPKVTCTSVATPLHSMTEEISVAMLRAWASACAAWIAGSAPASTGHNAGPNSSGIATVEPNMVKTC
jgi:hypothetical protein